jgi:HTH-type transcriptional regulator, transcriptional repressor of NAD biosynthesis genes
VSVSAKVHKPRFRLGLVVGKFSPLHQGHQSVIDHAAEQCDQLLILSYSNPEFQGCEADKRRRWLAQLYPQHECIVVDNIWLESACKTAGVSYQALPPNAANDLEQQHYLAYLLKDVLQRCPDAMFASEVYLHLCAKLLSGALNQQVTPVMVDLQRNNVPVSGTLLRTQTAQYWSFLPTVVRADWVQRIALLGGESSGKTTLAQAIAQTLDTEWVPEYGRELWEKQNGQLSPGDLVHIAQEQCKREDAAALRSGPWLVCDTSALTTLGYSLWMFGHLDAQIEMLAQRPYTLTVVCAGDFPFEQDGTRRDVDFQQLQHQWYLEQLTQRQIPFIEVRGSLQARQAQILRACAMSA